MGRHIFALTGLSVGVWALVLIDSPDRFLTAISYLNLGVLSIISALTRLALTLV